MKRILSILIILIVSLSYSQDVKIAQGKLTLDGCLWAQCRMNKDTFTFNRRSAFVGLTATLTSWATGRIYFDVADISGKPLYDLYANIKPITNLSIIFGQFKLPLGVEVLTKSENLELTDYSLIGRTYIRAPKGTRDIGLQMSYKQDLLEATLACVNGVGRNISNDDNKNKCLAGRIIAKPIAVPLLVPGINFYLGKYEPNTSFHRIGAEMNFAFNPISVKTEFLHTKDASTTGAGFYIQPSYIWKFLQPVIRFSTYKKQTSDRNSELTLGINYRPLADNLKIMLNYKYEKYSNSTQKILVGQLQVAF
ncbi:MAG: OprO/OprP family phosphate-selective porin [candidate division WOR-3 bacterium]|nr:OprO/OprP family phosphate-selective porin [candidate division WOR-3 bacterium]